MTSSNYFILSEIIKSKDISLFSKLVKILDFSDDELVLLLKDAVDKPEMIKILLESWENKEPVKLNKESVELNKEPFKLNEKPIELNKEHNEPNNESNNKPDNTLDNKPDNTLDNKQITATQPTNSNETNKKQLVSKIELLAAKDLIKKTLWSNNDDNMNTLIDILCDKITDKIDLISDYTDIFKYIPDICNEVHKMEELKKISMSDFNYQEGMLNLFSTLIKSDNLNISNPAENIIDKYMDYIQGKKIKTQDEIKSIVSKIIEHKKYDVLLNYNNNTVNDRINEILSSDVEQEYIYTYFYNNIKTLKLDDSTFMLYLKNNAFDVNHGYNDGYNDGYKPLILAAKNGNLSIVKLLIEYNALIEIGYSNGSTALKFAAQEGHIDVIKYLLGKGANINAKNYDGNNALYFALTSNNMDIAKYLILNGSEFYIMPSNGIGILFGGKIMKLT
jgi:ankyrin repeat protein